MNKVYLTGKIMKISDYKFFYNIISYILPLNIFLLRLKLWKVFIDAEKLLKLVHIIMWQIKFIDTARIMILYLLREK